MNKERLKEIQETLWCVLNCATMEGDNSKIMRIVGKNCEPMRIWKKGKGSKSYYIKKLKSLLKSKTIMKYKITIIKESENKDEDVFSGRKISRYDQVIFDAILSEEEVIEMMRVGYMLKEEYIRKSQATKS